MYKCKKCNYEFESPQKLREPNVFGNSPFEITLVCPNCKSTDYSEQKILYCHYCGARLKAHQTDYCDHVCKQKGEKLWKKELRRKKIIADSPLNQLVRETAKYNALHNTKYSYGQYVALIESKRRCDKKCSKKRKIF